jgi:predicted deacetylase
MKAIISIHDASPCFRKEIEIIFKELEGINKSVLVTPLWNGVNAISKDFSQLIAGEELALHGLTHRTEKKDYLGKMLLMSSQSSKEFYQLSKTETIHKIETAKKIFEDNFFKTPEGFVPPMWYHNQYTMGVLKDLNFRYTESASAFVNLRHNLQTVSFPLCFDFGSNKLLNYLSVNGWKYFFKHLKQPLLRLSAHPADVRNGTWKEILKTIRFLQEKDYSFIRYSELMKN